jgi:excisionase family DNA binding protein
LSLAESAKYLGVGKTTLRKLIRNNRLEPVRVYSRVLIPVEQLDSMIVGVADPERRVVSVPAEQLELIMRRARIPTPKFIAESGSCLLIRREQFDALMKCYGAYLENDAQEKAQH